MATKNPYNTLREVKEADTYGIRFNLLRKSSKDITDLNYRLNKLLHSNIKDTSTSNNSLGQILTLAHTSITADIRSQQKSIAKPVTDTGIRSIFDLSDTQQEMELVNIFGEKILNTFVQMHEYRMIATLIPELDEVLENVTRDILNTDEVSKRAIKNVIHDLDLKPEEMEGVDINDLNKIIEDVNKAIEDEVIDRNELELKIHKWIHDALNIGAKPILVVSYKDMLKQVFKEADSQPTSIESYEDYTYFTEQLLSEESLRKPSLRDKAVKHALHRYSEENFSPDYTFESMPETGKSCLKDSIESYYDKIIGPYCEKCTKMDVENLRNYYKDALLSQEAIEDDDKKKEIQKQLDELNNPEKIVQIQDENKKMLRNIVDVLDQKIEIIDPVKSQLASAKAAIQTQISYLKYKDTFHDGTFDDGSSFLNIKRDYGKPYTEPTNRASKQKDDEEPEDKRIGSLFADNTKRVDSSIYKDKIEDLLKDCNDVLINEYEADRVIPIYVNGNPLWYYIIEEDKYDGWSSSSAKKSFSFAEIFASVGFRNDDAVSYGTAVPSMMSGSLGPPIGSGGMMLQNIAGMMVSGTLDGGEALKKNELLKELILKTISSKLDDPNISDNKSFRDSIVNLIKDGFIIDKKVRITCVPASSMVYFGHDIDNDGRPYSFFKNTLLYCYLYLSSMISSGIIKGARASNRDQVKVNMGLSKRIGATLQQLEHEFGTKSVWNAQSFQSVQSILTQLGSSQTVYVPVFNNESLFEYEQMEKKNDTEIDDDFTNRLLEKILSTKVPNSMFNKFNEDDFAKSLVAQNKTYRNRIVGYQKYYSRQINKLIYLVIKNTKFTDKKINGYLKENMDKIDFQLAVPHRLNITNTNDANGEIDVYIENLTKILFGDDVNNESKKYIVSEFKKKLAKKYLPVDFDELEDMIKELSTIATKASIQSKVDQAIDEKVAEKISNDITVSESEGGDDMGGGSDYGSNYGNDDSGSEDEGEGGEEGEEEEFDFDGL